MGFDDLRPKRARTYADSWDKIGAEHGAEARAAEPSLTDIIGGLAQQARATLAAPEDDLEEGSACPQCAHPLSWIVTNRYHESQSEQLGCHACGDRFGESFP